jgi:hypothetical protein
MSGWPRRGSWREGRVPARLPLATRDSAPVRRPGRLCCCGWFGVRRGTPRGHPAAVKRHLADLRARSDLSTEKLIYHGTAEGRLLVPSLDTQSADRTLAQYPAASPASD